MSLIDLECKYTINVSNDCSKINRNKYTLIIGNSRLVSYIASLYFNIPPYPFIKNLIQAKLTLFKIPLEAGTANRCPKRHNASYSAYPLLDFFNIYNCDISIDYSLKTDFYYNPLECFTEIDITEIAEAWIQGYIENKGILIVGNNYSNVVKYASSDYEIIGMRPVLRLILNDFAICTPLSEVKSSVIVS